MGARMVITLMTAIEYVKDEEVLNAAKYLYVKDSDTLVVVFTSANAGYDLVKTLLPFNINKLFLRDNMGVYYHLGLKNMTKGIDDTAEYIISQMEELGVKRTLSVGTSCGGYAALLFAYLCGMEEAYAFAPQTIVGGTRINEIKDDRFGNMYVTGKTVTPEYFDLSIAMADSTYPTYHVWYDEEEKLDKIHAHNLDKIRNIHFHHGSGGHQILWEMKRNGKLLPLFEDIINRRVR